MNWQSNLSWELAKQRAYYLAKIRQFFASKGVIEVETPLLSHATITDVYIDAFATQYEFGVDAKAEELYLQTSPEFAMKRLLASGYGSIFQLCKAFRSESAGRHHNPEFTMLEWYRLGFDHFQLMDEVAELLKLVLNCEITEQKSYQAVFLEYLNIDPLATNVDELKRELTRQNVLGDWIATETDIDILLQVLFTECIETKIGRENPCFIYNYPSSQSALAKISQTDHRVAERFECYFKGIELANGFHELTDAKEQLQRFEADNQSRIAKGKVAKPIDQQLLQALENGLPDCAGVALGVDRLIMLALDMPSIEKVMTFDINNA